MLRLLRVVIAMPLLGAGLAACGGGTDAASNGVDSGVASSSGSSGGTSSSTSSSGSTSGSGGSTSGSGGSTSSSGSSGGGSTGVTIAVSPKTTTLGLTAMLSWSAANATSCTASGAWSGTQQVSGSRNVAPTVPGAYTYSLSCTGPKGSDSSSATLSASFDTAVRMENVVPLPVPQAPSPALSGALSKVRSFEYVIANSPSTTGINQAIGASGADLVFINVCEQDPPIDRAVADPTGTKLIFGYLDIGEAFACPEPQLFTGTRPSWFGNLNPGFPVYTVQYWNPAWLTALEAQIDRNIADGFDGIFIDVLTADEEWSTGNPENNPVYADATSALATI